MEVAPSLRAPPGSCPADTGRKHTASHYYAHPELGFHSSLGSSPESEEEENKGSCSLQRPVADKLLHIASTQ